jgi:mRNA interferase YafO
VLIQTCSLFRQLPEWEAHQTTFEDYKLNNIQPDFYGRDAELSHPHVHHIHLATTEDLKKKWSRKVRIDQIYYRTTKVGDTANDNWLLYAFDNFTGNYLLLTIMGPNAHDNKWRSYLRGLYISLVEPWIEGRLTDVV